MCVYVHTSTYEISCQFIRSKEVIFLLLIILTFSKFLRMDRTTDPKPMTTTNFSCTDSIHNDQPTVSAPNRNILWQSLQQIYPPGFLKKVVAEIIATFLLVFVTCGSAALSTADQQRVSRLGASVAGGLIVTVMIYAVGHISGAHMNPAVTLAFAAVRHFPWKQVPVYAAAQLTGAIGASFTLAVLLHPIENIGTTTPSGTHIQALIMEVVVTFSMMFITSAVATDTKAIGELAGIAVGSAVCITSILAGPVSGGSMNPARTIGPALASSCYKDIWVYIIGPIAGTLLGAWSYNLIRVSDKPVHELTSGGGSVSFKLRRMMSNAGHVSGKQTLNSV